MSADDGTGWAQATVVPPLAAGTVHIWRVDLDRDDLAMDTNATPLSPDETQRAARFHFPRDRRRFVACRVALRRLLGRYLRRPPGAVRFEYGVNGKPSLLAAGDDGLTFNVAHSDGWALIACTRGRAVGVDLEAIRPIGDLAGLAAHCLTPAELAAWRVLPGEDRPGAFYRCWARKESYLKALGLGLGAPLTAIDVTLTPYPTPHPLTARGVPGASGTYASVDLAAVPGYAAALTVGGAPDWGYVVLGCAGPAAIHPDDATQPA